MKIGFTGTRDGTTQAQRESLARLFRDLGVTEIHHGSCYGADEYAHHYATRNGIRVVVHPPTDQSLRAHLVGAETRKGLQYLERDRNIVDDTEALVAAPRSTTEKQRSGTWYTVRYARKKKRRIYIVFPDGSVKEES